MIDFITNSNSEYVIVSGGGECEKFAAEELRGFIKQSTGAELPVKSREEGKPFISIGKTAELSAAKIEPQWKKQRKDSFFCSIVNGNIFLSGKRERGTLYAVYDFLEKNLGVRFLASDETYVPKHKDVTLTQKDYVEEPAFDIRSFYTVQMENDALYTARLRQVALYGEEVEKYGYGLELDGLLSAHNILWDLDVDKLQAEHPEYFWHCKIDSGTNVDVCYSQGITKDGKIIPGGIADLVADVLIKRIKNNPDKVWFTVCQNDVPEGCGCDECKKNLKKYGTYSAILLRFINAVADKVEKWRLENCAERDVRLVTFAYAYTLAAPVSDGKIEEIKPAENVWMWVACTEQNLLYSIDEPKNSHYLSILNDWRKLTDRFCFWDYRINFAEYLLYFPGLAYFARDFAFLEKFGVDYIFCEATSGDRNDVPVWLNEIKGYVCAKLMWNTSADVNALVEEFCTLYYGKYGKDVLSVINLFETNYERLKENPQARIYLLLGYRTCESDYYPVEMLKASIEKIKYAIADCKDEKIRKRLIHVLLTPQRMLLRNYSDYFPNDDAGKKKLYGEFIDNCEALKIKNLGGWDFTVENLKKYPDYNWWKMNGVSC